MPEALLFLQDLAVIMIAASIGGFICKKIGLSPVVGYLFAGLVIGTPQIAFLYVSEPERIEVLAQVGMVVLMFGIGLGFRLRRLKELGLPLVIATALTAFLVFNFGKFFGQSAGFAKVESVFIAAMLLSSSSAVIGKVLQEANLTHQKHGQLAMGMTLLEDIVAVVMITFLSSYLTLDQPAASLGDMVGTVGILISFVLLLITVGLLLIPRMINIYHKTHLPELQTLLVVGMMFGISLLAVKAGYSLALGAFLLGAIVAETPQASALTRSLEGLKDVFSTVFFVAVGMTIDITLIPSAWGNILILTLICLIGRPLAAAISLVTVCTDGKTALRTGMAVTPMGEFAFIITGLGVTGGIIPSDFQVVAVGTALLTSLMTPIWIRFSEPVSDRIVGLTPKWLEEGLALYRKLWEGAARRQETNLLWRLSKKRIMQITVEIMLVTGILLFSVPILRALQIRIPAEWQPLQTELSIAYWLVLGTICLIPIIAIWRNCAALIMMIVDFGTNSRPILQRISPVIILLLQIFTAILMILWFWNFLPVEVAGIWVVAGVALLLVLLLVIGWRKLIFWHSQMEVTLQAAFEEETGSTGNLTIEALREARENWNVNIGEFVLPDRFLHAGRSIQDLALRNKTGATVVGIERQGHAIHSPGPQAHLFPGDKVYVLGTQEALQLAQKLLIQEGSPQAAESGLSDLRLETLKLDSSNSLTQGKSLAALNLTRLHGIQVVGAIRDGQRILHPGGGFVPAIGDALMIMATPSRIKNFRENL